MLLRKKVKNDQRITIHGGDIWDWERTEKFLPLDKSQGKHPEPPPRFQIPIDADWTGPAHQRYLLSAGGSIYRCVDILVPSGTRYENLECATYHLRLYMDINRDNRGSLATAYRAGGEGGGGGVRERAALHPCEGNFAPYMQMVGIYCEKREHRMNMWSGNRNKKREKIWTVGGQRRWDEGRPVRGKAEIATYREMMQPRLTNREKATQDRKIDS